jgi:hypothetical protein
LDIVAIVTDLAHIARAVLRAPLVDLRLLVETPAAWGPALAAGLLAATAWWQDRSDRTGQRWQHITDALACLFGLGILWWLFHAGRVPWTQGDWREEWAFFAAWKQALHAGGVPYYFGAPFYPIGDTWQGTERFLANLQTPMTPYVIALAFIDVRSFFLFHMAVVSGVGFLGAVTLRRELDLGMLPWTMFLLVFTLNGHIISHLSVGHLPWAAYFLTPWMLVCAIRVSRGNLSSRNVAACAATFGAMMLIGGWQVFVWSVLFIAFTCLVPPRRIAVLARIGLMTALLGAVRLAPAVVTYGGGSNIFSGSYPSGASLFASLVASPTREGPLDPWEYEAYVGYAGFLLLCLGAVPFWQPAKRFLNLLLLPTGALIVLSIGHVYEQTLFRLPGFVSQRVTSRFVILAILWLALAGAVRFDRWWRRARTSFAASIPVLLGVWFLAVQLVLRAHAWRPHVGPPLDGLPVDVLKTVPVEPLYFWAFWCGAAVSAVSTLAVARLLLRKESVEALA